jgi:hypothetical protein
MPENLAPPIPIPLEAIEIDAEIQKIEMELKTNLAWLDYSFGRVYRKIEKRGSQTLYFPEAYIGKKGGSVDGKPDYTRALYDDSKMSTMFFVVGSGEQTNFDQFQHNFIKWPVSLIFMVNLEKINSVLLTTELFTQNLIRDVRRVLTDAYTQSAKWKLTKEHRSFNEVFKEFTIEEKRGQTTAPHQVFRLDLDVILPEECGDVVFDRCVALGKNLSQDEIEDCVLPSIDFSDPEIIAKLSPQQITDLQTAIC